MNKVLLLAAHPRMHRSRITAAVFKAVTDIDGITARDLYEHYPDFDIDVELEQQLLVDHDLLALLHPVYWYSAPAIVKEWIDRVLINGFAYGKGGTALRGKSFVQFVSTGGTPSAYTASGNHGYPLPELLRPFERTALFCHMNYLPFFALQGSGKASAEDIHQHVDRVVQFLRDYIKQGA